MKYYKAIVTDSDGLDRLILVTEDQVITESTVLWDERISGGTPHPALLAKANADDLKRKNALDSENAKINAAKARLIASTAQDIKDLILVLGIK